MLQKFIENISIKVNENVYIKDPASSELGQSILHGSIDLLYEIGYNEFTMKKLSKFTGTSEASIYRYFENKHRILLYLTNWFWLWIECKMVYDTIEPLNKKQRLESAIMVLSTEPKDGEKFDNINLFKLYQIIVSDVTKNYFKGHKEDITSELYHGYVSLCNQFAHLLSNCAPYLRNPLAVSTSMIEIIFYQKFIQKNIPELTDLEEEDNDKFFTKILFKTLNIK